MASFAPWAGLLMLVVLGVLTVRSGLPVWALLIGVSSAFALGGVATGVMDFNILAAAPARLVGLLESDLLQALPLYVFVGMLLQRLTVADALFASLDSVLSPLGAGRSLAALAVGALIAPMNGSVASSSSLLARLVAPRLQGMDGAESTALVSVAATIGVVVPPSLVLILLGDAMMRAHTEASNLPGYASVFLLGQQRIVNTQDVFHAALLPGLVLIVLWALVARWQGRRFSPPRQSVSMGRHATAVVAASTIVLLLAGVFTGKLFSVEAAATACMVLLMVAVTTRALSWAAWKGVLANTLALSGALMAMLIGATVFSLVFRLLGTDRWLSAQMLSSPWPPLSTAATVLLLVGLCAWVLDAFEMIFVVIPIVAPPLIAMLGDAQQVAVLLLLVLQLSFLLPPMGYAVMLARMQLGQALPMRPLVRALAPFVLVQLAVVCLVFYAPGVVHRLDAPLADNVLAPEADLDAQMRAMADSPTDNSVNNPSKDESARPAPETPETPAPQAGASQSR